MEKEHNLLITGGSDFHGDIRPYVTLGCSWVDEDAFNKLNTEVAKRWGEYKSNNPFRIDEVLASKSAEAKEQINIIKILIEKKQQEKGIIFFN